MATKPKWIANTHTRELHRVVEGETHPGRCHFDDIPLEHRKEFRTATEAREAGNDVSAFCTKRYKSRDNK